MDICHVGDFFFYLKPQNEISKDTNREIAKVDVPGASPIYQDMGRGETVYSWEGALVGENALSQALMIEKEKDKGTVSVFSFGAIYSHVRIRKFSYKLKRFNYVKYSIELVEDVTDEEAADYNKIITRNIENKLGVTDTPKIILKEGQDLFAVAQEYNVDWKTVAKFNNIVNPRKVAAGTLISIPV